MRGMEAWVTSSVSDKDAAKALVLGRSLRRAKTTKPLVVLVSPQLSLKYRSLLEKAFDQVVCTDDHHSFNGWIGLRDYAKLYAFNLTLFRKCVYLTPDALVLKNCDEIFELCSEYELSAAGVKNSSVFIDGGLDVDTNVLGFTPSISIFQHLMTNGKKVIGKEKGLSVDGYLKNWLVNQKGFGRLDGKYNSFVSADTSSTGNLSIATLSEDFAEKFLTLGNGKQLKTGGIMESAVTKYWGMIYEEDILPQLSGEVGNDNAWISQNAPEDSPELLDSIAIVGISCRHPGTNNVDEFWEMLIKGQSGIRPVPKNRWTKEHGCKAETAHESSVGGFLSQDVDMFDGKFFGISRKEIEFLDPQQRLLLEVTWEALENASIDPLSLYRSHTGVYVGAWMNDYKDLMTQMGCDEFYRIYMGNSFGAAAARISYFLGLTGSSMANESGCSSAMVAVDLAIKSLRKGETNMALACGVNLLVTPFNKDTMSFIIAEDGKCKTFDEKADGFGRAEGCGVLVLKRYVDAVKDGDNICALIRGSSCVQEGLSRSMGTPTKECEALAMRLALKDGNVHPAEVSFVEAHGTGTALGDPLEISAIAEVYGGHDRVEPLVVGSVKTNIGHTESCSGISGIIKVVKSLQNEVIPKHLNLTKLNPKIDLDAIPAQIPMEALPWKKINGKPRLAGVSSFGITGTDGHVILQEAPEGHASPLELDMDRSLHLLKLSARTEEALEAMVGQYQSFLADPPKNLQFSDICYTANVGRANFPHRAVILAGNSNEAAKILQSKKFSRNEAPEGAGKVCFLFTGQGSQYPEMSKQLYETSPIFRMHFDECQKILLDTYGINIKEAIGNPMELSQTLNSQPAIFSVEYALLKLWESWGVKPDFVMGHSLGEFCAAVAANILSLEDALMLVAERSRLVQGLPKGKMLVVKADMKVVQTVLKEYSIGKTTDFWLDFAAVNSPEQTVLGGTSENVESFGEFCSRQKNMKVLVLDSSHAFHSRLMNPILEKYGKIAENLKSHPGSCQYISGVYGRLLEDVSLLHSPKYWIDHTRKKVDFIGASQAVANLECKYFLELGPQPILSALVSSNTSGPLTCLPSLRRNEENWKTILGSLSKLYLSGWTINWKNFDQFYSRRKLPSLPTYPFQRKKYWFDVESFQGQSSFLGNSACIHPLLGAIFPNASGKKIFQSQVDLKRKVDWVKDHCVGKRIIFPGAGFLEMCLSAGHCATEGLSDTFSKPSGPVTIENLKILAPLALDEKTPCQMQVVLDNSKDGMKVQVYKQHVMEGEAPKWTEHCESYFTPATVDFDEVDFRDQFNFPRILEECRKSEVGTEELYGKLADVGLKFGPAFQSLGKVWKGENGILAEAKVPQDWREYIVHPVLLDAMLQAAMVVQSKGEIRHLHVPIGIKKFSWLQHDTHDQSDGDTSTSSGSSFFIYSCPKKSDAKEEGQLETGEEIISILFDGINGKIIGFMSGMTFAETSVQAIESHLESQESDIPTLHSEVWKPSMGPHQNRINIWRDIYREEVFNPEDVHTIFKGSNYTNAADWEREDSLEQLCYGYLLKAYFEMGWDPKPGDRFTLDQFMSQLEITPQRRKLLRFQMTMLEREGILKFISDLEFQVINLPPGVHQLNEMIDQAQKTLEKMGDLPNSIYIYTKIGQSIGAMLQGKESGLSILFPEDHSKPSAESFYIEAYSYNNIDMKTVSNFKHLLKPLTPDTPKQGVMRILEVGAGTGNFTAATLRTYREHGLDVEYTFTDISPAFFINASKKFEEYQDCIKYQVLNLEDDAKSQGFSPQYYDLILGADVIHATKDLSESISNLRQLLRPNGLLCLIEGERQNHITCIFGFLDGYWRFVDTDIRQHHPLVDGNTWRKLCLNLGFDKAVIVPISNNYCNFIMARATGEEVKINRPIAYSPGGKWIVFPNLDNESKHILSKLSLYRQTITVWKSSTFQESSDGMGFGVNVNCKEHMAQLFSAVKGQSNTSHIEGIVYLWGMAAGGNTDQAEISQPFLHLCQTVMELKQQQVPKLFLITKGVFPIGDHLCVTPASSALWGMAKSCSNEMNLKIKMIDLCPSDMDGVDNAKDAVYELWNDVTDIQIAYRERTRYFGRLTRTKMTEKALKLPQCDRFQLVLPQSKAISDLKFGTLGKYALKGNEVEVKVKAAALNFRDVFAVMKPDAQFENINVVGSDFAGTVTQVGPQVSKWKVGDSVFGCNLEDGALPSHVRIVEDAVVKVPKSFTFLEASTLPAVFATAYYSLVTVAKMRKGETALIHTASGGVGISAIQICQHLGVNIIATAGSARKRAYLKGLGIRHVFHSRNTKYEEDILKVTNGHGVDLVLNSLTGPGFKEASLKVCSKNGRFVEMSKLSIWKVEEVNTLRPDVDYTIVDLTSVSRDVWKMLFETLDQFLQTGVGKPIPYVRFDGVHIREALTYLQKAKHIGKIVCVMPETKFQAGQYVHETPLFTPDSTYLITGGLGGIGFEVCKWMAGQGSRNLLIVSRSQPKEKHMQVIKSLRGEGVNVITKAVDVGDYAMCKKLIEYIQDPGNNLPPLRGIMHAAGVLNDATLINQNWEKYLQTFRPKVKGAWNLHELTTAAHSACRLEHFVMFSSMAALFGPPGQSNHAAGNAYLDGLACHRESIGLPAVTVNWGQWSMVGVAAGREVRGVLPFSPQRGLAALEAIMKSQRRQICVVDLELPVLMKVHSQLKPYLQNLTGNGPSDSHGLSVSIKSEKFWEEVDQAKEEDKHGVIKQYVKVLLRQILKLDDEEPIDDSGNFQDMGLDSLMMIELKNNLQAVLGTRMTIAASALADCHNIQLLTDKLIQQMNELGEGGLGGPGQKESQKLSPDEMHKLIEEDCKLPENLQQTLETLKDKPISKLALAKTFLLTGVTGKLGPFILKELLTRQNNGHIEKVYCLMRNTLNAAQRLNQSLKEAGVDSEIDMTKVHILLGDLASPKFGLGDSQWDLLAQEVDGVIHCAVKSNHVELYGHTAMRTVNVNGAKNILEFCCHQKTKHLFNSSSIVAVASTDEDGCLSEDWPEEDELNGVTDLGYPITKMIGDRLVYQAVQKGLPAKSFRFGGLIGHSKTGQFKHLNNHIMLRFLCYMKLGAMPSIPVPAFLLPVDIAAKSSMEIWFQEDTSIAPYSIYNLCHPNPALEQEFPVLAKEFGFEVDAVEYGEFVNRFSSEGEDSLLYPFRELYENEERYNSLMSFPDAIRKWLENPDNFFRIRKVTNVIPDYVEGLESTWEYVRRDLEYAKSTGLFDKFRLKK